MKPWSTKWFLPAPPNWAGPRPQQNIPGPMAHRADGGGIAACVRKDSKNHSMQALRGERAAMLTVCFRAGQESDTNPAVSRGAVV